MGFWRRLFGLEVAPTAASDQGATSAAVPAGRVPRSHASVPDYAAIVGEAGYQETLHQLSSVWDDVAGELNKEKERVQGAAIEMGRTFLHELGHIAVQAVIDSLSRRPVPRVSQLPVGAPRPEEPTTQIKPRAAA